MPKESANFWYREVVYPEIAIAEGQIDAMAKLRPGTLVVIMQEATPKSMKFFCPCGCGEVLSVNLMRGSGKAWRLSYSTKGGVSLFPSVWLDGGCQSHFILRHNTARLLFGEMPEMSQEEHEKWWVTSKVEPHHRKGFDYTA